MSFLDFFFLTNFQILNIVKCSEMTIIFRVLAEIFGNYFDFNEFWWFSVRNLKKFAYTAQCAPYRCGILKKNHSACQSPEHSWLSHYPLLSIIQKCKVHRLECVKWLQ